MNANTAWPEWAELPLRAVRNDLEYLSTLLEAATRGIAKDTQAPFMVDWMSRYQDIKVQYEGADPEPSDEVESRRKDAEAKAAFAKSEVESGFPRLCAFAALAIYSSLEAAIDNLLVSYLANIPDAREIEAVKKVKITLAEYDAMTISERHLYLIDQLELRSTSREGWPHMEDLLSVFGLGGPVHEVTRKDLFELGQVRNSLMHRGGIADRRLCSSCPWLGLDPGDEVKLNLEFYHRYFVAALDYAVAVRSRVRRELGLDPGAHTLRDPIDPARPAGDD